MWKKVEYAETNNQSVLKGFGYIERIDEGRFTKNIYRVKVERARGMSRLKGRLTDGVKELVEQRGLFLQGNKK